MHCDTYRNGAPLNQDMYHIVWLLAKPSPSRVGVCRWSRDRHRKMTVCLRQTKWLYWCCCVQLCLRETTRSVPVFGTVLVKDCVAMSVKRAINSTSSSVSTFVLPDHWLSSGRHIWKRFVLVVEKKNTSCILGELTRKVITILRVTVKKQNKRTNDNSTLVYDGKPLCHSELFFLQPTV